MKFTCKKCNSANTFIEEKGNNTGIYCSNCGGWIKWASKEDVRLLSKNTKHEKGDFIKFLESVLGYELRAYQKEIILNYFK